MTQDLQKLTTLIATVSGDLQAGLAEMRAEFADIRARLDRLDAGVDRQAMVLQTSSHWANQMNLWAEKVDRALLGRLPNIGRTETRVD